MILINVDGYNLLLGGGKLEEWTKLINAIVININNDTIPENNNLKIIKKNEKLTNILSDSLIDIQLTKFKQFLKNEPLLLQFIKNLRKLIKIFMQFSAMDKMYI